MLQLYFPYNSSMATTETLFQLNLLDKRAALIQTDVLGIETETSTHGGRVEKGHQNYFCTFSEEIELIKQAEAAIIAGEEIISSLYAYRSVSQSIPEISLSDYATEELTVDEKAELAAKTAEINQKLIEILRPEIGKMVTLMGYVMNVINLFNSFVVHGCKRKESAPELFKLYFLDILDTLMKVAALLCVCAVLYPLLLTSARVTILVGRLTALRTSKSALRKTSSGISARWARMRRWR